MIKSKYKLFLALLLPLGTGMISALLSRNGMKLYQTMAKPPLAPPSIVFPIAWTILYILMGIASYLVWTSDLPESEIKIAKISYLAQLIMNFFWSIIFFNLKMYTAALGWLIIMFFVIINCTQNFFYINRRAGLLMIPYNIWMAFATYLNLAIVVMNR